MGSGVDTLALAEAYEFSSGLNTERQPLPVAVVPETVGGEVVMEGDKPRLVLNPEVRDLLKQWGIPEPTLTPEGRLTQDQQALPFDSDIKLFIPLVDEKTSQPLLGFDKQPLLVPNPAVFHGLVLPELIQRAKSSRGKIKLATGNSLRDTPQRLSERSAAHSHSL